MSAFLSAGLSLLGAGGGLLGAHHKNAVAAEQTGIAAAQNQIESQITDVMNAFRGGQMSASEAKANLDAALNDFGSNTASIRTGGQEYFPNASGGKRFDGVKGRCNAACVYWANYADKIAQLEKQIDSTPQTVTQNTSQNAQSGLTGRFGGTPYGGSRFTPTGAAPGALQGQSSSQAPGMGAGLSTTALLGIGFGVVLLVVLIVSLSGRK